MVSTSRNFAPDFERLWHDAKRHITELEKMMGPIEPTNAWSRYKRAKTSKKFEEWVEDQLYVAEARVGVLEEALRNLRTNTPDQLDNCHRIINRALATSAKEGKKSHDRHRRTR
jgi:hypothetical protein